MHPLEAPVSRYSPEELFILILRRKLKNHKL